jgi:hypothetical protein
MQLEPPDRDESAPALAVVDAHLEALATTESALNRRFRADLRVLAATRRTADSGTPRREVAFGGRRLHRRGSGKPPGWLL